MHPVLFQLGPLAIPSYGVCAAIGALLALAAAQVTAPRAGLHPRHAWNMLVLAFFAALAGSRLLLIALNFSNLRAHPRWLLAISMIHHPLLAGVGLVCGAAAVFVYVRRVRLPLAQVADCLVAPVSLGLAAEQLGALLAGSDFGSESLHGAFPLAVTYTSELAARWSGTPLGVALYPVQAYAAVGALLLAGIAFLWLFVAHRKGDVAGVWLVGAGILVFVTEGFRDWEGRGALFGGVLDVAQLVGVGMVLGGGTMLLDLQRSVRKAANTSREATPAEFEGRIGVGEAVRSSEL